ncbi:MAG: valine--tRNA ligase [Lentisphaerae bacterium]|nr:valine--tRNA ligase [Lentisphaerota bacterium]
MEKTYDPGELEARWYAAWEQAGAFHGDAARDGAPYCIVMPPPNVTGILHMGHALNNTIQDILVRWRRMQGRNVVWMPGTDHAGIATQNVVERALREENLSREDLGREQFVERVWSWRETYGGTIIRQLKRLGCSCDWARERFTMDEGLSRAVEEVFVRLYEKGLIYRANYIINWCPRCHTALSDEESEHRDAAGKLYYIRYPLAGEGRREEGDGVVVATTRPETLLGDVAVAVNPQDARYRELVGRSVLLPVLEREIPVIADAFVDPEFGTGIVKVTPAHDPNDFEIGRRHELAPVNVMHGDGRMNENAGPYAGTDRFACREAIVKQLETEGLLEKVEAHRHAVGHCYRCNTVVEPRLSPQWFVRMKPLAVPAVEAVRRGDLRFVPARWTKVYLEWMENIRDWCISRQIWWGHRIPVFTCRTCGKEWAARGTPRRCPACGAETVRQDEDVLDTWFSSWLWPFSTFGWPAAADNDDLAFYYPTDDLVTASEIIFFWVARMVMAGLEVMGRIPFRNVIIHGTVRDDKGAKMSKSLGNSIDPLTIVEAYSADALRFSLMMITATGQDVYVSNEKFEIGRNFGTKLWNAARFIRATAGAGTPSACSLSRPGADADPEDSHILMKLQDAIRLCTESLGRYRFNDAAQGLYEFIWHQFCDWYVEHAKTILRGADDAARERVGRVLHHVLSTAIRLLHPMMPFLTEELWHVMGYSAEPEGQGAQGFVITAPWPEPADAAVLEAWGCTETRVQFVEDKHELIRIGRTLRADYAIPPGKAVDFAIKPVSAEAAEPLAGERASMGALLNAGDLAIDPDVRLDAAVPSGVGRLGTVYMPLAGVIDVETETDRLSKQLAKAVQDLERVTHKLENAHFVQKAPREVVLRQEARKQELAGRVEKLKRLVATLSAL